MSAGPGKYDDICTLVRERTKAEGVIVIVIHGINGSGFSAQVDQVTAMKIPAVLREVATQIENEPLPGVPS